MKNNIISRLDDAITVFGRFLRQAGCTVGPREIMSAIEASSHIEIHKKQDFKQALQATLISNNKNLYWYAVNNSGSWHRVLAFENDLAKKKKSETAIIFSTGYLANYSILSLC